MLDGMKIEAKLNYCDSGKNKQLKNEMKTRKKEKQRGKGRDPEEQEEDEDEDEIREKNERGREEKNGKI
ncbi:unnamed protein product, partial [Nesidiocoris tenuis]